IPLTTEAVKAQFQMRRTFNPRLDRTWMLAEAVRSVNATVTTKTTGIDGAVVKVLADAWTRVLVRVKYASRARTAQDGTTYHFGHRAGMRALAGTTSTPRKGYGARAT